MGGGGGSCPALFLIFRTRRLSQSIHYYTFNMAMRDRDVPEPSMRAGRRHSTAPGCVYVCGDTMLCWGAPPAGTPRFPQEVLAPSCRESGRNVSVPNKRLHSLSQGISSLTLAGVPGKRPYRSLPLCGTLKWHCSEFTAGFKPPSWKNPPATCLAAVPELWPKKVMDPQDR